MIAKALLRALLRIACRVEVRGMENARTAGPGVIIVANPQSRLDALLIGAFLPGNAVLAVDPQHAEPGWVRRTLGIFDTVRLAPRRAPALRALVRAVRAGRRCVIFPQGIAGRPEDLVPVYGPPALVAAAAGAPVLPVRIDGAAPGWPGARRFPKIVLTVGPARRLTVDPALRGRERRAALAGALYDVMAGAALSAYDRNRSVFDALLDARCRFGYGVPILDDAERQPLTYGRLVLASVALGRALARLSTRGEVVGVLLPNANAVAVTLFGLQAFGRVPAMLNYSMGPDALVSACTTAGVRTVLTSRRFIALGRLERLAEALAARTRLVYLEDVRADVRLPDKLCGIAVARLPWLMRGRTATAESAAESAAAVLFTSGSEGVPKGVLLSHANFLANVAQIAAVVDLWPSDRVVNPLPVFHSFGLTAGLLLPLLSGVPACFYPSPLHYRAVADMVAEQKATILFATDTFLTGYARAAPDGELSSLRYAVAGAEAVRDGTRRLYMDRFGVHILEGYGATETTPVMAVNTPTHQRPGTVGRFLPGVAHRLEPVQGVHEGGQLFVRGPNVMLGYRLPDHPAVLVPPPGGWHDTGDIVAVDSDGYVRILGRVKRFAKLGGEMVSLAGVEAHAAHLWPDDAHAAVALPDHRKGERIVLLTSRAGAHREEFVAFTRARGIPELMVPKTVLWVEEIPTLGSGKADYPAVRRMAENALRETGADKPA